MKKIFKPFRLPYRTFLRLWSVLQFLLYPAGGVAIYLFTSGISLSFTVGYALLMLFLLSGVTYTIFKSSDHSLRRSYANLLAYRGQWWTVFLWLVIVILAALTELKTHFGGFISGFMAMVTLRELFNNLVGLYLRHYPSDYPED